MRSVSDPDSKLNQWVTCILQFTISAVCSYYGWLAFAAFIRSLH